MFDVDQPEQFADRFGHGAAAFVAGTTTLRDPYLGPELFLVHAQALADFTGVHDEFQDLHFRLH